jgi:hypothetical protein
VSPKEHIYIFTMDPFPGGGRFEHHFDATTARKYLDARTAAVLALGEQVLRERKTESPILGIGAVVIRYRRGEDFVATWQNDPILIAALAADAEERE